MAEKRMFTQKIIDSDAFLDMPLSTQALYFHLNMRADDDGFVNNPKRIQRTVGASEDDLKLLLAKRFLLCFDNGVIVIKHWRMHNTLRKDRYNPTQYQSQLALLEVKNNSAYTEKKDGNQLATTWQPDGNQLEPQYSKVEESKVKLSKVEGREEEQPPCPSFASIDYDYIKNLYNTLCPSLPPVQVISASTKKAIQNLSYDFDLKQLKEVFEKAEASSFLKGNNERKWQAYFDWLIKPENIAKVLNGNYDDKGNKPSYDMKEFKRRSEMLPEYKQSKTVAEDEELKARAEALKQELSTTG